MCDCCVQLQLHTSLRGWESCSRLVAEQLLLSCCAHVDLFTGSHRLLVFILGWIVCLVGVGVGVGVGGMIETLHVVPAEQNL